MHSMFLPHIRCYTQRIWYFKSRFVYPIIRRKLLCNKSSIQWRGEPGARESPRPRVFVIAIPVLTKTVVYWGHLTCFCQPGMLPAIDCQGACTLIFPEGGFVGSRFANATPGDFTEGCWGSFSPSNWGWKPCKHKIRQTIANGVVSIFWIVY